MPLHFEVSGELGPALGAELTRSGCAEGVSWGVERSGRMVLTIADAFAHHLEAVQAVLAAHDPQAPDPFATLSNAECLVEKIDGLTSGKELHPNDQAALLEAARVWLVREKVDSADLDLIAVKQGDPSALDSVRARAVTKAQVEAAELAEVDLG